MPSQALKIYHNSNNAPKNWLIWVSTCMFRLWVDSDDTEPLWVHFHIVNQLSVALLQSCNCTEIWTWQWCRNESLDGHLKHLALSMDVFAQLMWCTIGHHIELYIGLKHLWSLSVYVLFLWCRFEDANRNLPFSPHPAPKFMPFCILTCPDFCCLFIWKPVLPLIFVLLLLDIFCLCCSLFEMRWPKLKTNASSRLVHSIVFCFVFLNYGSL